MARLITLIWLRIIYFKRGFRRGAGPTDAAVGVVLNIIGLCISIALAIAIGKLAARSLNSGEDVLRVSFYIEFYVFAILALLVPALVGSGGQRLGTTKLAAFPLSRLRLYNLDLFSSAVSGSHLLWYPAMVMVIVNAILKAQNQGWPSVMLAAMFAVVLVVWSHALLLLLEAVMRQRSMKELIIVTAFVVFMATMLFPGLLDKEGALPIVFDIIPEIFGPLFAFLPPSRLAETLAAIGTGGKESPLLFAIESLVWIVAGVTIGYLVFSRNLLEGKAIFGLSPKTRSTSKQQPRFDFFGDLFDQKAAIAAKELLYIFRSTTGKIAILVMPIFVVMIGLAVGKLSFAKHQLFGIDPGEYALYGILMYGASLSANFFLNAFAWEGPGLKAYFINPVSPREILQGKNIGAWIFSLIGARFTLIVLK